MNGNWVVRALLVFLVLLGAAHDRVTSAQESAANTQAKAAGSDFASARVPFVLTQEEKDWLKSKPRFKVGVKKEWAPIDLVSAGGDYEGLSKEYLFKIEQKLGLRFDYVAFDTLKEGLDALRAGEVDLLPSLAITAERQKDFIFSNAYLDVPNAYFSRREFPRISAQDSLEGLSIAVEKGYGVVDIIKQRHPLAKIIEYQNTSQAVRAVSTEDADIYLGALPTTLFLIEQQLLSNIEVKGSSFHPQSKLHVASLPANANLISAINKALSDMSIQEREHIHRIWMPTKASATMSVRAVDLSKVDREKLARLGSIKIGIDDQYPPISFKPVQGPSMGLGIDYIRTVLDRLGGVEAEFTSGSWDSIFTKAKAGSLDILVGMVPTPERRERFNFVGPIASVIGLIVVRTKDASIVSLSQLNGKKLALLESGPFDTFFAQNYPQIQRVNFKTRSEIMIALAAGKVDASLATQQQFLDALRSGLNGQIKIGGIFPETNVDLYLGIGKNKPELYDFVNRAFATISSSDKDEIAARWYNASLPIEIARSAREVFFKFLPYLIGLAVLTLVSMGWGLRLKSELRRRRAAEAALDSARLKAEKIADRRKEFIEVASHEIRGPLQGLVFALNRLRREVKEPKLDKDFDVALQSGATLLEYTNNILDLSKSDAGYLKIATQSDNLVAQLEQVVSQQMPSAQAKNLWFECEYDGRIAPRLEFDALRIRQVLSNLVSNAIKYTDQGGLRFWVRVMSEDAKGQEIRFTVADSGKGIELEKVQQLLNQTADEQSTASNLLTNSGIGLAISQRLVQAMGGRIDARALNDGGSEFSFRLNLLLPEQHAKRAALAEPQARPAANDAFKTPFDVGEGKIAQAANTVVAPSLDLQKALAHCRVLVADDDRLQIALLALEMMHHKVAYDTAERGLDAWTLWQTYKHPLVFVDCRLNGLNGYELARRITQSEEGKNVLIFGLSADADDWSHARESGMQHLLQKPVSAAIVNDILQRLAESEQRLKAVL